MVERNRGEKKRERRQMCLYKRRGEEISERRKREREEGDMNGMGVEDRI